jgi:hypothetical protein
MIAVYLKYKELLYNPIKPNPNVDEVIRKNPKIIVFLEPILFFNTVFNGENII